MAEPEPPPLTVENGPDGPVFIRRWDPSWEELVPVRPGEARCETCRRKLQPGQRWEERPACSLKLYHVDPADCGRATDTVP